MTSKDQPASSEAQAFQSAVKKLMQVSHDELQEKMKEEKAKKGDRPSEDSEEEEGDRLSNAP